MTSVSESVGMPRRRSARITPPRFRRASALAEFVLFLPFIFLVVAMIFHFGVSNLRKQRTIMAVRFATDAAAAHIGDVSAEGFWLHPVSGNQHPRWQAFPDPLDHYLGLFDEEEIQSRFLPRLRPEDISLASTYPDDGVSRLRAEVERRDLTDPPILQITRTFWEQPYAATNQQFGEDLDFRWHIYSRGAKIGAAYQPKGPYFERLQGPIRSHYFRESASWAFPYPDMWWELNHSDSGLADLQQIFYDLAQDPVMGLTGEMFLRWFQH